MSDQPPQKEWWEAHGDWTYQPDVPGGVPQQYVAAYSSPGRAYNRRALWSLGLAILSFVDPFTRAFPELLAVYGVTIFLALYLGYRARSEILAAGGRQRGRLAAKTGIVLGWIALFFWLFVVMIIVGHWLTN